MEKINEWFLCRMQELAKPLGSPIVVLVLLIYSVGWFITERGNIGWDGFGAIAGLLLVIIIQSSQNRDSAALHAKIDELITAVKEADSSFAELEKKTDKEIEAKKHHSTPSTDRPN